LSDALHCTTTLPEYQPSVAGGEQVTDGGVWSMATIAECACSTFPAASVLKYVTSCLPSVPIVTGPE
jgi:hypothetical protein